MTLATGSGNRGMFMNIYEKIMVTKSLYWVRITKKTSALQMNRLTVDGIVEHWKIT